MDVGKNIKLIRIRSNLKQKKLAKMLGVSASYLSQVESGNRNPSMTFIKSFSEKLKVPMSLIFSEDYAKLQGVDPATRRLLEALQTILFDAQATQIKKASKKNIRQLASR